MKKIVCLALLITVFSLSLIGCDSLNAVGDKLSGVGDKVGEGIDNVYAYDYAYVSDFQGNRIKVELDWYGVNLEHKYYMFKSTDDVVYYTGLENCVLVDDPDVDINAITLTNLSDVINKGFTDAFIRLPDGEVLEIRVESTGLLLSGGIIRVHDTDGNKYYVDTDNIIMINNP